MFPIQASAFPLTSLNLNAGDNSRTDLCRVPLAYHARDGGPQQEGTYYRRFAGGRAGRRPSAT